MYTKRMGTADWNHHVQWRHLHFLTDFEDKHAITTKKTYLSNYCLQKSELNRLEVEGLIARLEDFGVGQAWRTNNCIPSANFSFIKNKSKKIPARRAAVLAESSIFATPERKNEKASGSTPFPSCCKVTRHKDQRERSSPSLFLLT